MAKLSTIVIMFVFLLLGFLAGYSAKAIAVVINENKENRKNNTYQKYPRRTIAVEIEVEQQGILFGKLRNFADTEGFAIRIAPTTPNGLDYSVEMWREDVMILALNSFEPGMFEIGIFDIDRTISTPEWAVDSLKNKLINYLEEIPKATITEEK